MALIAYPGGKIFIDNKPMGQDATDTLTLQPGNYQIRIVNRFLGEFTATIAVTDGQTGTIPIHW